MRYFFSCAYRGSPRSCLGILVVLTAALAAQTTAFDTVAVATPGVSGSTGSLNAARADQTSTRLFGGKVLLAGGRGEAGAPLASSELFDPDTGASSPTAGALLTGRFAHTATLISGAPFQCGPNCKKVLVVGGTGPDAAPLASAELFNPATGTWTNTGALETPRSGHTATLLSNGRILAVGGSDANGAPLASAEVFNPATGTWSPAAPLASARSSHTATILSDGKVVIAGGVGAGGAPLASAELYDPATGTWSPTGSMTTPRSAHSATPLGNEISGRSDPRVLVAGGLGPAGTPLASAELYDPATGTWRPTGSLAVARSLHAATPLPDGKVFVAGGAGADRSTLASAELFDPSAGTWSATGPLAAARFTHTATVLRDGRVFSAGGVGTGGQPISAAELYEPPLGPRWTATAPLNDPRSGHTATLLGNGEVLVAGGHTSFDFFGSGCCNLDPVGSAEIYDPQSGTWTRTPALEEARSFHTATLLPNGKILVAGGFRASSPPGPGGNAATTASAELYDPSTGQWTSANPMLEPRAWHTATLLASGKVLVVGGTARPQPGTAVDSAELYDPATGSWIPTGSLTGDGNAPNLTGPRGAREVHTATLLAGNCGPNCGKVLVAGGTGGIGSGPAYQTAELYDPATGTFQATDSMGQLRQVHTASLLTDGKVLVAGGFSAPFPNFPPHLDRAERYDPVTEEWEAGRFLTSRRMYHTATPLPDGNILAAGGNAGGNAPGFPYKPGPGLLSAELYSPDSDQWSATIFMNTGRAVHTATRLATGQVLVAGGDREVIGNFSPYLTYMSPLRSAELYGAAPTPPAGPGPPGPEPPGQSPAFPGCPPASAARNVLALTSGNDRANGTPGNDLIFAGTGEDVIDALAGDDCVDLGPGKDRGQGGPGDDLLVGGQGDDRVAGSSGNDRMRGDGGDDRLVGERGNDRLFGQSGNDLLLGGLGNDLMVGQSGSDRIVGSRGRDRINGGRGNDRLFGESSADRINAGSGKDRVRGGSGNDVVRGDSGNDRLIGDTGRDRIFGGLGNDLILAVDGQRDRIRCGVGFDRVVADRIDRVDRASCERVRRVRKKRSRSAALGGVPALLRGVGF